MVIGTHASRDIFGSFKMTNKPTS
uniref:Uncharacterized protein n=1 Tax=Anguilla anguilla TaxID=7936 RepID=A0A0E9SNX1_ANGAN